MKNLETKDLLIRKPKMEDVEPAYNNWFTKTNVACQQDFNVHANKTESEVTILSSIDSCEHDLPVWVLESKENGEVVGFYDLYEVETKSRIALFEKLGAKLEGNLRNRRIDPETGKKLNRLVYSILKEEVHYV